MDDRPDKSTRTEALEENEIAGIARSLSPIEPPADRAAALRARVLAGTDAQSTDSNAAVIPDHLVTVRVGEREWQPYTPGVEICVLHEDEQRRSALFRLQPGGFFFPHHHVMSEESVILEGEALVGDDLHIGPGDYQYAPPGTAHAVISSESGCIVLVHGERRPKPRINLSLASRLVRYFLRSNVR